MSRSTGGSLEMDSLRSWGWLCILRDPPPPVGNVADDSPAALIDRDVLDANGLLAGAPISLERFHLSGECPRKLIESALRAVLLLDILRMMEPVRRDHGRMSIFLLKYPRFVDSHCRHRRNGLGPPRLMPSRPAFGVKPHMRPGFRPEWQNDGTR